MSRPRLCFVLLLLLAAALGSGAEPAPVAVQVAVAVREILPRTQPVAGTVRPLARATIAAKVTGTVRETRLAIGQVVAAGTILVTLQAAELEARVNLAQATLAQADRELARERTLESQGGSTTDAVRAADDRRRQAQAAAQEAEAMLSYTRLAAPFDGVITGEFVKAGDLATPGRALFEIEGQDRLQAEVQVPESLALPALESAVAVLVGDATVTGAVAELSPAADPTTRTRLAKIALPAASGARSGQFVRVLWPAGTADSLSVPAAAVSLLGQMERVFVVTAGHARLRLVKTGPRTGDRVEIVSGLDAGEAVVLNPGAALRDGQAVEIRP